MDFYELKNFRLANSTREKTNENTLKIKLTFSTYGNGTEYYQEYRYINPSMIEEMKLVKCDRCDIYMDGGIYRQDINRRLCYACSREETLRECFELLEKRSRKNK